MPCGPSRLPSLLLALALLLLPAPPPAALGDGSAVVLAPEVRRAYQWLALVALAGGGTVTLLMRWLRGGGSEASPLVEPTESRVEAEELLEPDAFDEARYEPARGRVIRAYLRFLSRAREAASASSDTSPRGRSRTASAGRRTRSPS